MRRKDREITERKKIVEIMKRCDVCNVGFFGEEYPYIIPMNFGFDDSDDELKLYFHSAKEGTKLELLKKNSKAAFSMNTSHKLILDDLACSCTMEYKSVCGNGTIRLLENEKKTAALECIMKQYQPEKTYVFNQKIVEMTTVMELKVEHITGKQLKK